MRGRGQFVADLRFANLQDVAFVRSPYAHARIVSIEIPAALRNREYGESSASTFRAVALIAKVLITTIFRLGPGVDPLLE